MDPKPFREQYLDAQITRAIEKSLDRVKAQGRVAKSGKPGEADAQPDRRPAPRLGAVWTKTHMAMLNGTALPGSVEPARGRISQGPEPEKKRKPRNLFVPAKGTPVWFIDPDSHGKIFAKVLRVVWGKGQSLVAAPTTGEWMVDNEDLHPVTSDELEAKKLRDLAKQEAAGADLATHTDDDIRPGAIVSYADKDDDGNAGETKVVVVARVFDRYGHHAVGVDGHSQTHVFKPGDVTAFHRPEDLP